MHLSYEMAERQVSPKRVTPQVKTTSSVKTVPITWLLTRTLSACVNHLLAEQTVAIMLTLRPVLGW